MLAASAVPRPIVSMVEFLQHFTGTGALRWFSLTRKSKPQHKKRHFSNKRWSMSERRGLGKSESLPPTGTKSAPRKGLRSRAGSQSSRSSTLAYRLFLLVNAAVFLRPNELFPAIKAIPLYELLILSSATLSIRPMFQQFRLKELKRQPISLCVIGVLAAIAFRTART